MSLVKSSVKSNIEMMLLQVMLQDHLVKKKYKRIADWAKKTGKKYGTCSKCKGKMNLEMAIAQKKNKRPDGVECLACINGYKRKPI